MTHQWTRFLNSQLVRHQQAALLSLRQLIQRPFVTGMICIVIAIALALPMALYVSLENAQTLSRDLDTNSPIMLYLKKHVTEDQTQVLREEIAARPEVSAVRYISPEEGLSDFKKHAHLDDILATLPNNPLPALLVVTPGPSWRTPEAMGILLESLKGLPQVEIAQFDLDWIKRLDAVLKLGQRAIYALAALLGLGVIFVIGSVVHFVTQERKEEIFVFQLVGANDAFIRRPFVYAGMWYGLLGGVLASVFVGGLFYWLSEPASMLAELYGGIPIIQMLSAAQVVSLWGIGTFLGVFGSWVAVRPHL